MISAKSFRVNYTITNLIHKMYVKFEERVNGVVVQHIISGYHGRVRTWQCQRVDLGTVRSGKTSRSPNQWQKYYTTHTKLERIRMTRSIESEIVQIVLESGLSGRVEWNSSKEGVIKGHGFRIG